jgi:hypothetical protein
MKYTSTQYFIKDIVENRYYCNYPDGYSLDILDAVSFDTRQEVENRIDEIIVSGKCLIIIEAYVRNKEVRD